MAWSAEPGVALSQARAIIDSALVDARDCALSLKTQRQLSHEDGAICYRALAVKVRDSRQRQAQEKLLALARDPASDRTLTPEINRALRAALDLEQTTGFILERMRR